MKTKLIISAMAVSCLLLIASCKKQEQRTDDVATKVINVDLNENESYSYTMPASGDADDVMEISLQAQHSLTSKITAAAGHSTLFEYTPAKDYSGTDEIHVNTVEGQHKDGNNGEHHNGNCQHHSNETETSYIFKINIIKKVTTKTN